MRFRAPTARSNSSPLSPGLPHPVCSVYRLSQPLDVLLLELPCGLVSCHWHSWGSPCGAFPPDAVPHSRRVWRPGIKRSESRSTTAGCMWKDSQTLLARRQVRPNNFARYLALTHIWVRSHPALVLPAAGGRCSRGIRDPSGDVTDCPGPKTILSCALGLACKQVVPCTSECYETINQNLFRKRRSTPPGLCVLPAPH
jgi:hypothetical protein